MTCESHYETTNRQANSAASYVCSEAFEEPWVLPLVDGAQDGGGRPAARVNHGAVGDSATDVLPRQLRGWLGPGRRVHHRIADKNDHEIYAQHAILAPGRIGVLHALVAHHPGVARVSRKIGVATRDAALVRPEAGVALGGRPDALVQLQEEQRVVGHLLQHIRLRPACSIALR